jgi:adenylate cyclase
LNIADRRRFLSSLLLVVGAWLVTHGCFRLLPNVFEAWNAQTVDQLFRLRNAVPHLRPRYDDTVVHVDLNNSSLRRLKTFSLSRSQHAQVVANLAAMHVAVQAHDYIFSARPRTHEDEALIAATAAAGNVYYGLALALESGPPRPSQRPLDAAEQHYLEQTAWPIKVQGETGAVYTGTNPLSTFAALATAARGLGYLSVVADRDGVYRRMPLLVRYGAAWYPSFALRVACDYLQVPPEKIELSPGKHLRLRDARRPGAPTPHDIIIPIDRHGQMVINYLGTWERLAHYSLAEVLLAAEHGDDLELFREQLAGKLVVVGDVYTGVSDVGAMPLDPNFPLSGLHSNMLNSLLTEQFLRELSTLEMLALEVLLLLLVVGLSCSLSSRWLTLGTGLAALAYVGLATGCFFYGQIICNMVRPLLMVLFSTVALVVHRYVQEERAKLESLRQRDFVRDVFGRYLSNAVVDEILGSPRGLAMGGELRQITLLVSDLRGFTSLSARLSPPEVITILNRYFERMIARIAQYRGTVDELMGDGMLVFFGAPLSAPDDPERAVACALDMQLALLEVNRDLSEHHLPELAMGIGINTGEVIVGNIGSLQRSKYGAVGSAINTTYRIESYTVGGQIFISPSTYERVRTLVQVRGTLAAQFKGLDQPVILYDICGIAAPYDLQLPEKAAPAFITLPLPLPLQCFPIDGKIVAETAIAGHLTRLAGLTAEGVLAQPVAIYTNVKLLLMPSEHAPFSDIYAKVLALTPEASGTAQVQLELTSLPDDAKAFLNTLAPVGSTACAS